MASRGNWVASLEGLEPPPTTEDLPDEVLERVLSWLDPQPLGRATAVCRRWADAARCERLWCAIFHIIAHGHVIAPSEFGWRDRCREALLRPRFEPMAPYAAGEDEYGHLLQLVICGDSGVGKSCFLKRFCNEQLTPHEIIRPDQAHLITIGVDFGVRACRLEGNDVKLQMWDTAGHDRFRGITASYFRGAKGFLLLFDVTRRSTFDDIRDSWAPEVCQHSNLKSPLVIVGIRHDHTTRRPREVEETAGHAMARDLQAGVAAGRAVRYTEANPAATPLREPGMTAVAGWCSFGDDENHVSPAENHVSPACCDSSHLSANSWADGESVSWAMALLVQQVMAVQLARDAHEPISCRGLVQPALSPAQRVAAALSARTRRLLCW